MRRRTFSIMGRCMTCIGKVKDREEKGIAVVGSSNLTLAGVTSQYGIERGGTWKLEP